MATVQTPPGGKPRQAQAQAQGQQKAKAALGAPLPEQKPRRGRRFFMTLLGFLVVVGVAYGVIRFVPPVKVRAERVYEPIKPTVQRIYEPVRALGEKIPWVGPRLFAKKETGDDGAPAGEGGDTSGQAGNGQPPATGAESPQDPVAQALEEVAKRETQAAFREEQIRQQEAALAAREAELNRRQVEFDKKEEEIEGLKLELEARIREEKARAAIIANMRTAQAVQMLNVMDDEEVLRIMKYLDPELNGKIFAAMDPYKAARLMMKLGGGELQDTY